MRVRGRPSITQRPSLRPTRSVTGLEPQNLKLSASAYGEHLLEPTNSQPLSLNHTPLFYHAGPADVGFLVLFLDPKALNFQPLLLVGLLSDHLSGGSWLAPL